MLLSTLKIERFGARSNLQLADISDHLNVVYGPNGSGKTTIINFIRWMLYGNPDGALTRFLSSTSEEPGGNGTPAYPTLPGIPYGLTAPAGELTVHQQDGNVQRITRQSDGTAASRVSIADASGATGTAFGQPRLTGVDLQEYRTIFSFGFDQPPAFENLVQTARSHGFELTLDERRLARVEELTAQINRQRAEQNRYSHYDIRVLAARREAIHGEIANLESRKLERLAEIERQRSEILAQIEQRRAQLGGIQSWLQQVDTTIQTRRSQLEAAAREAQMARDTYEESRHRKIEEIDRQVQQWHQVLDSVRARFEELKSKQFGSADKHIAAYSIVDDESDLRCLTGNLGHHVDDLEQDLAQLYYFDDRRDVDTKYEYFRGIMGTALQAMRADVTRLTAQLRQYKSSVLHHEYESERKHLLRCEQELGELIISLSKRRDSLSTSMDAFHHTTSWQNGVPHTPASLRTTDNGHATEPLIQPWYESPLCADATHGRATDLSLNGKYAPTYRPTQQTPANFSVGYRVDPVLEARLYHLQVRRNQIVPRVNDLEAQIRELESRLGLLDAVFNDEDQRIEHLRHELQQIDEQARWTHEYDRLENTIRLANEEVATLRAGTGSSAIMQEASAILGRITCQKYRGIRVLGSHQIIIDDASGRSIDYSQASRGTRDQAYLSVCLALAAAYKRRNVQHPLILNDVFINIDQERANATADVLSEFARQGHQVLLFTRHERVMQLFPTRNAKIFTLGSRVHVPPETISSLRPAPATYEPPVVLPPAPPRRVVSETSYDWVSHWEMPKSKAAETADAAAISRVAETVSRPVQATESDAVETSIGLGSPLDTVPTIDVNLARHFRDIGVVTIGQFLELDPDAAFSRLAKHRITADQIVRWQSEISLQVYLCISGNDARILVECGIGDPEDLAIADAEHLYRRISRFLTSEEVRHRYQPFSAMNRKALSQWIDMARRSNYGRRHRSTPSSERNYSRQREQRLPDRKVAMNRGEDTRIPLRTRSTAVRSSNSKEAKTKESTSDDSLKFYLNMEDPIVDAPSIGPKTAERFHAVGINTVAELLTADPLATADQIDYRRITPEIISEWQTQAKLAAQIPNLRGHDAQILAACEVTDADELTRADASTLYKRVKRFVSTTEGKRVLRNGKRPDQNEVADWIRWSEGARQLEPA